jgi:ADP-ribose pyrophosphatase YjhB (NUDIX family)
MIKRVFTQVFGVVGAIIEKDGKILLVKEGQGREKGKWNHPAGWIDVGENLTDAVIREVKEESGYDFTPTNILGVYSLVKKYFMKDYGEIHHPIKIIYIGKISDEQGKYWEHEISEVKWFTPQEIENMDKNTLRDLDIKIMVKDYFAGKKYSLNLITHTISE